MATIPSGVTYLPSTAGGAVAANNVFTDRWNYVAVTNSNTTAINVTADGSTASTTNGVLIAPNETVVLANGLPYWNQTVNVIPIGSLQVGGNLTPYNGTSGTVTSPSNPETVTPMTRLPGETESTTPGGFILSIAVGSGSLSGISVQCLG